MHYSNLKNEEALDEKAEVDSNEVSVKTASENKPPEAPVKKEAYWFIAMILTFIMIGSIVFFVSHTSGRNDLMMKAN